MAAYNAHADAGLVETDHDQRAQPLRVARAGLAGAPSPVHGLQETLNIAFSAPVADLVEAERWSMRRTIAFVVAVCGGFWMALAAAVYVLLH